MRFLGRNIIDSLSKKSFNFLKFRETLKKYKQNLYWKLEQQAPSFGSIFAYLETVA